MTLSTTLNRPAGLDTFRALVAQADAAHASYPQYRNHWNEWQIARMTKRIATKMGVAFEKGDVVLCSPQARIVEYGPNAGKTVRTCYSFRNTCDTSVPEAAATIIG